MKLLAIILILAVCGWLLWAGRDMWTPVLESFSREEASPVVGEAGRQPAPEELLNGLLNRLPAPRVAEPAPVEARSSGRTVEPQVSRESALERLLRFEELPEAPPVEVELGALIEELSAQAKEGRNP